MTVRIGSQHHAIVKQRCLWLTLATGAVFAASGSSTSAVLPITAPQPILRYRFDDAVNPTANSGSLGAAQHGSIHSGSWHFTPLGTGQALTLSDTSYVEAEGNENELDIAGQDFSIYARVRPTASTASQERIVIGKRDGSAGYSLGIAAGTGRATFTVRAGGSFVAQGTSSIDDGQWHDVLGVREAGTLSIYVDGVLQSQTGGLGSGSTANSRSLRVGRPAGGSGGVGLVGDIDEVGIYAEAVTPVVIAGGIDCNHNGMDDAIEIANGSGADCNANGVLDSCEGSAAVGDCNNDGICDAYELTHGLVPDVNGDNVPDDCQASTSLPYDIMRLIVFGDSPSDDGNLYALTNGARPLSPPNFMGRFSDGRVWCEYLAGFLGIPPSEVHNFAFGGARTDDKNSHDHLYRDLPGLADEIEMYRQAVRAGLLPAGPDTLFVVWIGPNDFNAFQQANANIDLDSVVHTAMTNIEHALRDLVQLGARKILVPNMPDLGATPLVRGNPNPELAAKARIGSIGFNANLSVLLAKLEQDLAVDIVYDDVFRFLDEIIASPGQYGFTDVVNPCLDDIALTLCADASSHLFWDELHPTTAAHRLLALRAQQALLHGGDPLPALPLPVGSPHAEVCIDSPVTGSFTLADSTWVRGTIAADRRRSGPLSLDINGVSVPLSTNGEFSAPIPLDVTRVEQPILAILRSGDLVVDRERIVVFRGESIESSSNIDDAAVAQLTPDGIRVLTDELLGRLFTSGTLDIRQYLLSHGPVASDHSGGFQYDVIPTNAGFLCCSLEIVPTPGRLLVKLTFHDLFIDYSFHGWSTLPDPGLDCNGTVTASRFAVFTELALHATGGSAGQIDVVQTAPLDFEMLGFGHTGQCAMITDFVSLIPNVNFSVEMKIREAIADKLGELTNENALARKIEEIVAGVSLSSQLGSVIGAHVEGDIRAVNTNSNGVRVAFVATISPVGGGGGKTYAVPYSHIPLSSTNPATGLPCEFKLSVAVRTLNQLLLALWPQFEAGATVNVLDLGAGDQPLTSGRLSALVPALDALGDSTPMEIRIRPTAVPMLLGQDGSGETLSNLYVGQVLVEFVPLAGPLHDTSVLSFAIDLHGGVDLEADTTNGGLHASAHMSPDGVEAVIVTNLLGADESALGLLFESFARILTGKLADLEGTLPMPELAGLTVAVTNAQPENGYVTLVADLESSFSRPDLIVEYIDTLDQFDILSPLHVTGRIKNIGTQAAYGSVWIGASLSVDAVFMNGDEIPMGPQLFLNLGNGLQPGESMSFTLNLNPVPNAVQTNQTLFVLVDVPNLPGGTGAFCEHSEYNNFLGVSVDATVPDAYVSQVTTQPGVIGPLGAQPSTFLTQVTVGRNNVGPASMQVPVRIAIGQPVLYWVDVLVNVPRGQTVVQDVWMNTPVSTGSAGQSNTFPIVACTILSFDSNPSNNCSTGSVAVAVPWWDLRFDIINAPASATHCFSTGWDVKVTNAGNVASMNVCAITGIVPNSGAGVWGQSLGILNFTTPSISPGASWTYHVNNYYVNCAAFQMTQYIKTEVNYAGGCFDQYTAGNFKQKSIAIH